VDLMRFRLSRSLTFWLGLPGLLFLLWAWADSFDWQSRLSYSGRLRAGTLASDGSTVSFEWIRYEPLPAGAASPNPGYEPPELPTTDHLGFARHASSRAQRPLLWAKFGSATGGSGAMVSRTVSFPYWMIVLTYLGLWVAAMAWRWQRARRLPNVDPPRLEVQGEAAPFNPARR
jgi:hypothetical protein